MKDIIYILLMVIITCILYILGLRSAEYHVRLLPRERVELLNKEYDVIVNTTLDSIPYFIDNDNI